MLDPPLRFKTVKKGVLSSTLFLTNRDFFYFIDFLTLFLLKSTLKGILGLCYKFPYLGRFQYPLPLQR